MAMHGGILAGVLHKKVCVPCRNTCVFISKTVKHNASSFGWDVKPLVPCVVTPVHLSKREEVRPGVDV